MDESKKHTRRAFMQGAAVTLAALTFPEPLKGGPQAPEPSGSERPWEAYPYTKIDYEKWPALSQKEKEILNVPLSPQEARKLMEYKVDHCILDNKPVMDNLKHNHNIKPNFVEMAATKSIMGTFYDNVRKELEAGGGKINVAIAMDAFWRRLSAHAQVNDIQAECRRQQGKDMGMILSREYPIDLKTIGPAENWRGNIPFDPKRINTDDNKTIEDIARRRPQLDFPKIFRDLEIPPDILKVMPEDLVAALSRTSPDIEARIKAASPGWTTRIEQNAAAARVPR